MTQIFSDEEFVYRLSKSLSDVKNGRTMTAETLKQKMTEHAKNKKIVA